MTTKKIAPTLREWMNGNTVPTDPLMREVKALLAVARAARQVGDYMGYGDESLARALARLDRVSAASRRLGEGR